MEDWVIELYNQTVLNRKKILEVNGSISHEEAIKKSEKEFKIYRERKMNLLQSDFDFLYNKGIKTTGIDISSDMIKLCERKNSNINFLVSDITKFISKEKYDLITLTCDVVNHILEENKLEILLKNIYNMLNEDGYLIFDVYDEQSLILNNDIISNRDDGIKVHYYITEKESLINTNVKVIQNENLVYEYDVLEKLYDIEFIKKLLIKCNFKIIKDENKIMNEKQRFEDKIYIICKK